MFLCFEWSPYLIYFFLFVSCYQKYISVFVFVVSCCKPLLPLLSCVFVLSFVKSVFAVGSEAVAVFDIIFKKFIDCRGCFRGWLIGLLFLVVLGWMIVCCYYISWQILWLIDMIVYCGWLYVVVVCCDCLSWLFVWLILRLVR